MSFPVIIEEIDENNSSSSPKIEKITLDQVDRMVELVQEFSRSKKHDRNRSLLSPSDDRDNEYDYSYLEDQLRAANLANADDDCKGLPENGPFTDEDIPKLRARWLHQNADILN
ncbi:hypothetical protein AAF712_016858, partial [Marasmius tenuissimus]